MPDSNNVFEKYSWNSLMHHVIITTLLKYTKVFDLARPYMNSNKILINFKGK